MHPLTYHLPHTHIHTVYCSSGFTVCTSSGRPKSVIAASVAWTDRRTGDWRWHAHIISGPSAVFAITEGLAEHTESDSGILYSGAISTPTGCTASVGPSLNNTGLGRSVSLKIGSDGFWIGYVNQVFTFEMSESRLLQSLSFSLRGVTQVAEAGR